MNLQDFKGQLTRAEETIRILQEELSESNRGLVALALELEQRVEERTASLRESEERFRLMVEGVQDYAIFMLDTEGRVETWNAGAQRIKGYAAEEIIGQSFSCFYTAEDIAAGKPGRDLVIAAGIGHYTEENWRVRRDGSRFWANATISAMHDGEGRLRGYVKITRDMTERKKTEEALQKANAQLTEADQRKDEFLAMLAHELRNPLAPVRNAAHILRHAGPSEPLLQRQRDVIERQVTHMARLLDDLLDVSRITRGKVTLQRQALHLSDVLAHAVETVASLMEARHHTLHVRMPPDELRVEADMDRLAQVVCNVLVNAAKYTDEGGQIWLEASREGGDDAKIPTAVIRVRDNGVGIDPQMLPRVFDLFTQADQSLGRSRGGLGIGLTMVKRLVDLHGGSVEAHSAGRGLGSEFIVRLPLLAPEAIADQSGVSAPAGESGANARRRVLVVDDNQDSANTLCELIELWGYPVRAVYDGMSALATANQFKPDIVLLDIGMPQMDGYEVARSLRRNERLRPMHIVALTGYGQETDRQLSSEAGFNEHLVKPVDLIVLGALLERVSSI